MILLWNCQLPSYYTACPGTKLSEAWHKYGCCGEGQRIEQAGRGFSSEPDSQVMVLEEKTDDKLKNSVVKRKNM